MDDPRIKILIIAFAILVAGGIIAGVISYKMESQPLGSEAPVFELAEINYDFGDIAITGGLVSHNFEIKNTGHSDLKISDIKTSCMCTTAYLEINGEKSPKFGMHNNPLFWSKKIAPGQTAILEAVFDPMFHGPDAVGPVTRTVSMMTNDKGKNTVKTILFTANVVR